MSSHASSSSSSSSSPKDNDDSVIDTDVPPVQQQLLYRPPHSSPRPPAKLVFCHNCGDLTHTSNRCELPIMSYGAIAYRYRPEDGRREFLMICRRHSFGYLDFMRGRLPRVAACVETPPTESPGAAPPVAGIFPHQIVTMIAQMTRHERAHLVAMARDPENAAEIHQSFGPHPFPVTPTSNAAVRVAAWIQASATAVTAALHQDPTAAPPTVHILEQMVRSADAVHQWDQPEWGFPKGKRNTMETDRACALREFGEETGMPARAFTVVALPPGVADSEPWPQEQRCTTNRMGRAVRETFRGSNGKRYSHRYLLLAPPTREVANLSTAHFQKWEVSDMQWFTVEDACARIRPYNHEKRAMLENLDAALDAKKRAVAAMMTPASVSTTITPSAEAGVFSGDNVHQ